MSNSLLLFTINRRLQSDLVVFYNSLLRYPILLAARILGTRDLKSQRFEIAAIETFQYVTSRVDHSLGFKSPPTV
mgnify:CR=1 FL=1